MDILQSEHESKGFFQAVENGVEAGRLTYSKAGTGRIILDHTEVNDDFRGKNVGKQLVAAAVDYARKNQVKIMPLCPFAGSVFAKTPEFADVLW